MPKVEMLQQKGYDFLWIDDELWMWNLREEKLAQCALSDQAHGKVLVAGYGLGILQECLDSNSNVTSITTVEQYPEVITTVYNAYGKIYGSIIIGDFNKLHMPENFDCVIGDIWKDIIPECLPEYKRFKKVALKHLFAGGKYLAWGQELFEYLIEKEKEDVGKS